MIAFVRAFSGLALFLLAVGLAIAGEPHRLASQISDNDPDNPTR
jgi:hypothetical protein